MTFWLLLQRTRIFFSLKLKLPKFNCIKLFVCEQLVVRRDIGTDFLEIPIDCHLTNLAKTQLNLGVSDDNLVDL